MSGSVIAGIIAPHTPRMGVEQTAPDFVRGLIDGERELGAHLRAMKPDLIVLVSAHWVCTFNWYVTAHETHRGICVADEAPDLIPGTPYERLGAPHFANKLTVNIADAGIPCRTNTAPNFKWDYASLVPLLYIDPDAQIPIVLLPTCLSADLDECMKVGKMITKTATVTDSKIAVIASCALSHAVVRGPELWPTEERISLDKRFINLVEDGRISELVSWFPTFSREAVSEMGGRVIATMLGALESQLKEGTTFQGQQFGAYAQSSGSGNASLAMWPRI